MSSEPIRILLTNDDGIDAHGLAALERALEALPGVELWTVAPDRGRSTCGHGMTLFRPLFAKRRGERRFAVDGLPADCVYLGMFGLMDEAPDIVVSGINHGANLGSDVIYSGTVAGAREAAVRGVTGIGFSLCDGSDFDHAARVAARITQAVVQRGKDSSPAVINVNFPSGRFTQVRMGKLGRRVYPRIVERRTAPLSGDEYFWLGGPPVEDELLEDSDAWVISRGMASVTFLALDQTDQRLSEEVRSWWDPKSICEV